MRIALLQDFLRNGGTEQQTLAIARGLSSLGAEIHIVVFKSGGVLEPTTANSSFQLHRLNQGPLKTDWFAPALSKKLAAIDPDLVIPMGRMANCHAGLLVRNRQRRYKIVATFRTGRRIPFLYRRAAREADFLVANSAEALSRLATDYRIERPETSRVIYNGCIQDFDTTIPSFPPSAERRSELQLCSISMFRPQKKQIRLIQICARLPQTVPWRLVLAGDGPTLLNSREEAKRLGVANRVEFPGLLKDPRSLYFASDIAVHASDQESLPNFLVESQMSGLPVVAYDVNGVGETFAHGSSGYLIPHRDEDAFLEALQKLASDPPKRLEMGEAARAYARQRFSLRAQSQAYFQLARELTAGN